MDLRYLIELIIAWKKRIKRDNFKKDAAHPPQVHLVAVVAICQQAFWRPIPSRTDVLSVRLLAINASTTAKVSQFYAVIHY